MKKHSKVKILIITVRADFGGGPEHIFQLTKHLQNDFDFYFAAPDDYPYYERYYKLAGSQRVITIPHRKFRIKTLINLARFIFTNRINVIHSHGKGAGIYGRILGIISGKKVVHTFHGLHIGEYKKIRRSLYLLIEKLLSWVTEVIISVSESERKLISGHITSNTEKLKVIQNGIEIPAQTVFDDVFEKRPKTVITFSRFDFSKNTELIIEILIHLRELKRIDEFNFIILGSGPDEAKIKDLVRKNNLQNNITFPGSVLNTKEFLLNSFCYLSTSRWEGLPLGVLEAFSVGLPVIASNVAGNKDVISHDVNGFLYDLNRPSAAAEFICLLCDNKEKWLKFSQNARNDAVNMYDVKRMAEQTQLLYDKLFMEEYLN